MSFLLFQQSMDREIWLRLQSVTDSNSPSPVIPPNHVPHPFPLSKSSAYFPITGLVCQTHLVQLQNTLFHLDVTSQDSFHAILLTTNNAVRLQTDVFPNYRLQCTYTFNATLAELQEPDGIPVSSRVGHAVILFYPGEHKRTQAYVSKIQKTNHEIALLGDKFSIHVGLP